MTRDEIRDVVLRTLLRFAPEADLARIPPEANLRDDYMPYWSYLWPAAQPMARRILESNPACQIASSAS